ncbi:hypothetical protein NEA10_12190 [Phormidium yuhuli AB48]|uniref:Transferase hexapeptide repeat containing protein n=1 Tax=Phormidium yuhuli AB48 TaxID=2940671 RepID=A0ABY5AKC6_9CYAN|nr:hypothetical protein [Phormidium yuhuli]USR89639.1 hypothetical protein NEA10_12190 [Phormidium yuhuli AB48]
MTFNVSLEKRLASVEAAIAEIRQQMEDKNQETEKPQNWLDQITGSFEDEPAFDEVLQYGQAIRQGDESILGQ